MDPPVVTWRHECQKHAWFSRLCERGLKGACRRSSESTLMVCSALLASSTGWDNQYNCTVNSNCTNINQLIFIEQWIEIYNHILYSVSFGKALLKAHSEKEFYGKKAPSLSLTTIFTHPEVFALVKPPNLNEKTLSRHTMCFFVYSTRIWIWCYLSLKKIKKHFPPLLHFPSNMYWKQISIFYFVYFVCAVLLPFLTWSLSALDSLD